MSEFDWQEYLAVAERLLADEASGESEFRTAVGRAYYAAFHAARIYLRDVHGWSVNLQHGSSHAQAWRELRAHKKNAANLGDRLKMRRHRADYNGDSLASPKAYANESISLARNTITLIEK